jgi:hypothetical protein
MGRFHAVAEFGFLGLNKVADVRFSPISLPGRRCADWPPDKEDPFTTQLAYVPKKLRSEMRLKLNAFHGFTAVKP